MRPDLKLIRPSDTNSLNQLETYLDDKELTIIFVHENHVCPRSNHEFLLQQHVKLVVYSDLLYQTIKGMTIDALATVAPHHFTEAFHEDSTPHLIGLCICNQYTQGHIPT